MFRKFLIFISTLFFLVGAGLVSYVGWEMYGTNIIAKREQDSLVKDFEKLKCRPVDRERESSQPYPWSSTIAVVTIPRFGKDYKIPLVEGFSYSNLHKGFVRWKKSVKMGNKGNTVIGAHRTTRNEPLRHMDKLRRGDKVFITTPCYHYEYIMEFNGESLKIPFNQGWMMTSEIPDNPLCDRNKIGRKCTEPFHNEKRNILTIVTCAALFHTDERLATFAILNTVIPR